MTIFSVKEVADKLVVTRQRVDQLMRTGRIAYVWIGRTRVIYEQDFLNFIKEREKL